MVFTNGGDLTLAWLRRVYETYPRRFSLAELLVIFGILVIHRWVFSFWHWGIYRLDLAFPEYLSDLFYRIWLESDVIRAILISFLLCVIVLSNYIRRVSWEELGIRLDNIWKSGRECLAVLCIILSIAAAIVLAFPHKFSFDGYFDNKYVDDNNFFVGLSFGVLSGTFQQFFLQSIFLVRALQVFRRKSTAILTSSILFSLLHAPNAKLMILTLLFGVLCSLLFIRNRNIITLGAMHGVVQQARKSIVRFLSCLWNYLL